MQIYLFGDTAVVTYIKEYRQTPDTTKVIVLEKFSGRVEICGKLSSSVPEFSARQQ